MGEIVALCRRRGFVFQSSEIYGGINGFWDYGPLGVELKRNLKQAWWRDMVRCPADGPDGKPIQIVGLDSAIIMNPKVWAASGHVDGFNDPMVDCRLTKNRYRADHLLVYAPRSDEGDMYAFPEGRPETIAKKLKKAGAAADYEVVALPEIALDLYPRIVAPDADRPGSLTEPRQFNLMFETFIGAVRNEEAKAHLRPETAQGAFANFWNVVDTSRVKVPFGIAQIGKAFRNEVTPRNFTFRSREFEQMELEFFIHPSEARQWYDYWRDLRFSWWRSMGLSNANLVRREHGPEELAHYAKQGAGACDLEYRFPFTAPGYGELEGIAHRADFDLVRHAEHAGKGDKLRYFDAERQERYFPHVIEPAAGADRGALALLCEAYTPDPGRPSKVFMNFAPGLAPIKAAIFPLVAKDGMPEAAEKLYRELRPRYAVEIDIKQTIGKRYARMDEAGTPYCFTIDGATMMDQTVTVRDRDTLQQQRIDLSQAAQFLADKIDG